MSTTSILSLSVPPAIVPMMPDVGLSPQDILTLRNRHVSESCRFHFMESPLKIVRSRGQYMYNEHNEEYLDCTSRTTAVGHCHPDIVAAACAQMGKLNILTSGLQDYYSAQLLSTLPSKFDTCFFTSSGAEANDLALQLAEKFTRRKDIAVVDGAFHGSVVSLMDISPKAFRVSTEGKKSWVHVIPCPDIYRGQYNSEEEAGEFYFQEAVKVFEDAKQSGRNVGCFICEPLMIVPGVIVPPKGWLKKIYRYIQENGGIVIADEIVSGMGRIGTNFWAFQSLADGAIPDIVTVGKPLGNGHPIAAVLTSQRIASVLCDAELTAGYRCGPVESAVGLSVLKVLEDEKLMANAHEVGLHFRERLKDLQMRYNVIGDIRGMGLVIGVDIVRGDRIPAADLAERISYRLKEKRVLVAPEGERDNILVFMPPFCLTRDDVHYAVSAFNEVLLEITMDIEIFTFLNEQSISSLPRIPWTEHQDESPRSSDSRISPDYQALD